MAVQHDELDIPPRFAPRAAPAQTYRVRQREADGSRRLMIVAGAIGGAALLAVVGGWSLLSRGPASVPVIMADSRPIRVKPEARGGLQVAGANDDIMAPDGTKLTDALAAPTETPQTEQLRQMQQADLERNKASAAGASLLIPVPMPPTAAAATPPPAPTLPALATAPTPRAAPAAPMHVATNEMKPAEIPRPTPSKPAPAEARQAEPVHPSVGKTAVQLAAVGSEDDAKAFWRRMSARMPELLLGRKPALTRIERDGRTFWRVRVDGFADTAAADSFCEQVRTKGGGCSVAAF